ncbi:acyl-CoA N-acyltransferase [Spinellus fusiger]|nr:acyl-CoA N-acyltransferase [Spinellus fusiger]
MSPLPSLPPSIKLANVTTHNISQLISLHAHLFPIAYNSSFYKAALEAGPFAQVVLYNDMYVGSICCRIESHPYSYYASVYIQTLGVLQPYRNLGLGHRLLSHIIMQAAASTYPRIYNVYLHVQVTNQVAISFYQKHGFQKVDIAKQYYYSMECKDAYILSLPIYSSIDAYTRPCLLPTHP